MPNITTFKSALADGGARPNQFKVFIPFPGEAETPNAQQQLLVSGAALPASTVNPVITQYRGREVKFAGERIYDPWTITVINNSEQTLRRQFEAWMNFINDRETNEGEMDWSKYQTDITVEHLHRNNKALTGGSYILQQAFPINMSEIALQYAQNDIIEEYTVTFQYQAYTITN